MGRITQANSPRRIGIPLFRRNQRVTENERRTHADCEDSERGSNALCAEIGHGVTHEFCCRKDVCAALLSTGGCIGSGEVPTENPPRGGGGIVDFGCNFRDCRVDVIVDQRIFWGAVMKPSRRRFLPLAAGAAAWPVAARAQVYPARPVRVLVGAARSGPRDIVARVIAQSLSERLGQQRIHGLSQMILEL
jgi:hypothetical protein